MQPTIRWGSWLSPLGTLQMAVTDRGLAYLGLPNQTDQAVRQWLTRHFTGASLRRVATAHDLRCYTGALGDYLDGTEAGLPAVALDLVGTPFQLRVWQWLSTIDYGATVTYGAVAAAIGCPQGVRAVGQAIGQNPVAIFIPCHRVIGQGGHLTGYRGGLRYKAELLALEGHLIHHDRLVQ